MNVCPICLYVNPADAGGCARCGKFQFPRGVAVAEHPVDTSEAATHTKSNASSSVITRPSGPASPSDSRRGADEPSSVGAFSLPKKDDSGTSSGSSSRLVIRPRLEVVRGEKLGVAFPLLEGRNLIGRMVNAPVDLDLTGQEPAERVWTSRHHACVIFDGKTVILEDLNSLNGTFVNRQRVYPGQQRVLHPNDVVQVGTVQLRLLISADRVDL